MSSIPPLVRPPEWPQLHPFGNALENIVLPAAVRLDCVTSLTAPPQSELEELSHQIHGFIQERIGAPLHPAIWVHGLKVCCHFYGRSIDNPETRDEEEGQRLRVDSAYALVRFLESHHGLYDLYIKLA